MSAPASRLSRRSVLAALGASTAALVYPGKGSRAFADTPRQPNFLYIMADDMGYADISCNGRRDYATPEIDALARQGVRFTQAYANSAVCTATRVALITGRYQYRLPVGLEEPLAQRNVGLPPSHPTLPSLLRKAGYRTGLIGKWHLGSLPDYDPQASGYDEFWGIRSGAVDYFTHASSNGKPDLWDGKTPLKQAGYLTDMIGDHAVAAVKRNAGAGKPWLLSLHFTAPHWPWETPEDEAESRRLAQSTDREALMHFDGGSQKTYAGMVQRLDMQVGRILRALEESGQADNTVVVFTSDNGGERFADTWPFTGKKTELLEGGLRIPAIVRWPGLAKPGSTSEAQIISMDWLPTFVAAAGGTVDPAFAPDGIDIRTAIGGGTLPERALFWRYKLHDQQAARRGKWKYLKIGDNSFLFDVEADPLERGNLKALHPDVFASLTQEWARWNATMLPLDPQSYSHGFTARTLADHFIAVD